MRTTPLAASFVGLAQQGIVAAAAIHTPRDTNDTNLPPLRFTNDGRFSISVFSDLHMGQYQDEVKGPKQDRYTIQVISDVLDAEEPDLVVINGDLVDGDTIPQLNATHYIDQIVAPLVERNLTWAATYGNHDHHYNVNGEGLLERERMFPGSRTQSYVSDSNAGTTNYYLPVYPSDCVGDQCTPELILWFFDSRGGAEYQELSDGDIIHRPEWVDISVVRWFNETKAELVEKYNKTIPSLGFVHIPTNATSAFQLQVDKHNQPGVNEEYPNSPQGKNWCSDNTFNTDCAYGGQDVPFMQAIAATPEMISLSYGHDHGNTWCFRWDSLLPGMDIAGPGQAHCYGVHSGYGNYGNWARGGRQIVVTQEKLKQLAVDTHIRLETGEIVSAVTLNATFNQDSYPATSVEYTYLSDSKMFTDNSGSVNSAAALPSLLRDLRVTSAFGVWATLWCMVIVGCIFGCC